MNDLVSAFVDQLTRAQRPRFEPAEIGTQLHRAIVAAMTVWPGLEVADSMVGAYVGAVAARLDIDTAAELATLCIEDLYLACGCTQGVRSAIATLRRSFFGDVEAALRQMGLPQDVVDELQQDVFDEVLTARDGTVPIAGYSGRGPLRRWLRSIAVRHATKRLAGERRSERARKDLQDLLPDSDDDIEVAHFKHHYAGDYSGALSLALETLSVSERNVLRQYFIDGLTVDELGQLYQIHRSTAARRVTRARERVLALTVDDLRRRLGMSPSEVVEVGHLVRSQLELSFVRLLK